MEHKPTPRNNRVYDIAGANRLQTLIFIFKPFPGTPSFSLGFLFFSNLLRKQQTSESHRIILFVCTYTLNMLFYVFCSLSWNTIINNFHGWNARSLNIHFSQVSMRFSTNIWKCLTDENAFIRFLEHVLCPENAFLRCYFSFHWEISLRYTIFSTPSASSDCCKYFSRNAQISSRSASRG